MREPFHVKTSLIRILALCVAATQTGNAMGEAATRAVLNTNKVRVEADLADGRLRERYLAKTDDDAWVEVATSADVGDGPICLYGSGPPVGATHASGSQTRPFAFGVPSPVRAMEVSASASEMTETFSAGLGRIVRKISCEGNGPWLRVTTRLEPAQTVELQSFADGFVFAQRAEWSYSPSVGGFNPDAQYKAPLILVQSKGLAFGIVPDVTALNRDVLRLCHHALDLDVTATPSLRVGFMPAKLARHSVYRADAERTWKLEKPLENTYFQLVTAAPAAPLRVGGGGRTGVPPVRAVSLGEVRSSQPIGGGGTAEGDRSL